MVDECSRVLPVPGRKAMRRVHRGHAEDISFMRPPDGTGQQQQTLLNRFRQPPGAVFYELQ
jgi:hypothetical protein